MKRWLVTLGAMVTLGTLFYGWHVHAQPSRIPHENPATAASALDKAALLLAYGNTFGLTAARQYNDARSMLDDVRRAEVPDKLRSAIDRYNSLSEQLVTSLDKGEFRLNEASSRLSNNHAQEAKEKLHEAEAAIQNAQSRLEETQAATSILGEKLGVFAAPVLSQLRQAYEHLERNLENVQKLIDEINQSWQGSAGKREIQAKRLMPTALTLSVSPSSVFVGDNIVASGTLSSGGIPLPQRKLVLFLNNRPLSVATGSAGSYTADIVVPYEYVATMTLYAEYIPTDADVNTYQASKSPPVIINTRFHTTLLEISVPGTGYPGRAVTINGQISSDGVGVERNIRVSLDGTSLAEEKVRDKFSLELKLPSPTSTGKHTLTVEAPPEGRYTGAAASANINVSKLLVQTRIQTPPLILLPTTVRLSGEVYHDADPVANARVSLGFKDAISTVSTAADGSFAILLKAPLDLSLFGHQELTVMIEPLEPWYASLEETRQAFVINLIDTGSILIAFGLVSTWALIHRRVKIRPAGPPEQGALLPRLEEMPAIVPVPESGHKLADFRGKILSAYTNGLEAVQKTGNLAMASHLTLSEFLELASPVLPTIAGPFAELTTMAEVALYSTHVMDDSTVVRAEQLAASIRQELHNGTE